MNRTIKILLFLLCMVASGTAKAALAPYCIAPYEAITTIEEPYFGVPNVWDAEFSVKDKKVEMIASLPRENLSVLSVGRVLSSETDKVEEIVLVELNYRGRALLEKRYRALDDEKPVGMIKPNERYVVASNYINRGRRQGKLSWYDQDAELKKSVIVTDATYNYDITAIRQVGDGSDFVVLVRAEDIKSPQNVHSVMMKFNASGGVIRKRSYNTGAPNVLYNIISARDGNFLATGAIEADGGGMAGWVMEFDSDGAILWQRIYRRGATSALTGAVLTPINSSNPNGYVLFGHSSPLDQGELASWVMAIDGVGEPIWQHYYRSKGYSLEPKAISTRENGRLILLMNALVDVSKMADKKKEQEKGDLADNPPVSHIRLLTLSPRGALLNDEQYVKGTQAVANGYTDSDKGERIITTTAMIVPMSPAEHEMIGSGLFKTKESEETAEGETEMPPVTTPVPETRGWVFVGTKLRAYEDPCQAE